MRFRHWPFALAISSGIPLAATAPAARSQAVACELDVAPDRIRMGDAVEFRYLITSTPSQRISGRSFRQDEELFGHSLRLRATTGAEYRFLRTTMFSYLGHLTADPGEATPKTYRFAFPNAYNFDYARLVPAPDWRDPRSQSDSTLVKSYATVWDAGVRLLPLGTYDVSAELFVEILHPRDSTNRDLQDISTLQRIRCRPTRLVVAP